MSSGVIDLICAGRHQVALRGIRVWSRLTSMGQRTIVEQTFINLEPEAIEVTYAFPLPERAAVCGFEVITGERVLTGQIEELEKASELYEEAIGRGDAAYNLREHRPDVFSIDVGNLKPQQMALVRLTYVSELEVVDGSIRLVYPTVVAPRYATATATDPIEALRDAHALNPPHLLSVPYGLSLDVEVSLGRPIRSLASPSHRIVVENRQNHEYRVTLAGGLSETDREIVLNFDLGEEQEPRAEAVRGSDGRAYLAVTFLPELEERAEPVPSEVVFVLDCSGSMQGLPIAQAKSALDLCLRHLSEGDCFNICRFGSSFEWMSAEPLPYRQETLEHALRYLRYLEADLGGTELYGPLESFLSRRPCLGGMRQVILLTDGQISNEPAVIGLARRYRSGNRIFTFGIGPASSRHLVRGLAEATRGAAEFITEGERIEEKVLRTFSRLATPDLTDLVMRWDGGDGLEQSPTTIPPIFNGDALTVYARCPEARVPGRVALKCMSPAGALEWAVNVPAPAWSGQELPLFWARRMIQSLEDSEAHDPTARQRCIELSKQFGLLCHHTSFIAIEHRSAEERNNGQPATRRIPVQIPRGWHGVERFCLAAPPAGGVDRIERFLSEGVFQIANDFRQAPKVHGMANRLHFWRDADVLQATSPLSPLMQLLQRQQADGSFEADDTAEWRRAQELAQGWIGSLPRAGSEALSERVVFTIAALLLLSHQFADEQALWRRAAAKAYRYLSRTLAMPQETLRSSIEGLANTW